MSKHYLSVLLVLAACGKDEPAGEGTKPSTPPTAPPTSTTGADAPPATEAPPPAADKTVTLNGLGLTMTIPGCAIVKADEDYRAMIQPETPECRALTLMGIEIRDAAKDFKPEAEGVETTLGGTDVKETRTDDVIRLEYTARRDKGLVIHRTIGGRSINCRGEGNDEQIRAIDAACTSLAPK